jgi:hypothetical protein
MELLRNWYFIQASATDIRARKMVFDDALMGQLIRFVSSHEVGHTLGLRHNFGSSATVPVENLRNKKWLDKHGHTPSIMDYARFNYVAQPEDNIGDAGMYPHIGEYDKWAIQWGYQWLPQFNSPEAELGYQNKLISDSLSKNPLLVFGTESDPDDPRNQSEAIGDNAMKASEYGIKNLKRIMPNILEWTKEPNEDYTNASTIYDQLVGQFSRYMGHVTKNIGGIETTPSSIEQSQPVIVFTSKNTQKEAINFLQNQLFTTPKWLLDKKLYSVTGSGDMKTISGLQNSVLGRIINNNTISKLLRMEAYDPATAYTATEMLNDLKRGIWSELATHSSIDIYRRNLQKIYTQKLVDLLNPDPKSTMTASFQRGGMGGNVNTDANLTDNLSIIKGQAKSLIAEIKTALPLMKDNISKLHLQDVMERLQDALKPQKG